MGKIQISLISSGGCRRARSRLGSADALRPPESSRASPRGDPLAEPSVVDPLSLKPRLERAFDFAARQVRSTVERYPDFFPIYTAGGRWLHQGELWTDWCGGFHAGMMWLIAGRTGEAWWRRTAEHYSRLLEHRQHDRNVHDLGFIFLNTYLPWYRAPATIVSARC